jgi:hypothetical protein
MSVDSGFAGCFAVRWFRSKEIGEDRFFGVIDYIFGVIASILDVITSILSVITSIFSVSPLS